MGGNVTVDPRERATPIDDPAIVEARSLRTGRLLDAICGRKGASSI